MVIIFRPCSLAVGDEVGHAGHRAVVVHHLADHAGRVQAGEAGEVDGGLGVAGALEHAARLGLQREDVARAGRGRAGAVVGVDRDLDGVGAVVGGDAGGDALAGLDRDGERRLRGAPRSWPSSGRRPSSSQRSGVSARQIRPRACLAMKLIASGVANWAAITRSPSFSRSSSSTDDDHPAVADVLDRLARWSRRRRCRPRGGITRPPAVARRTWRARRPRG